MRLLDTDVVIDLLRGVPAATMWLQTLKETPVVSGFVVMELLQGCLNVADVQSVRKLVQPLPVLWPSRAECEQALDYFAEYRLTHGLGLLDSLIAASAIGAGATLCTFNVKHYRSLAVLVTEQPYSR